MARLLAKCPEGLESQVLGVGIETVVGCVVGVYSQAYRALKEPRQLMRNRKNQHSEKTNSNNKIAFLGLECSVVFILSLSKISDIG